jgi:hypothetical protein
MAVYATKRTPDQRDYVTLTLTTGASGLSDVADLCGMRLASIYMGTAAWTNADIAFFGSHVSSASMALLYRLGSSSTSPTVMQFVTTADRLIGIQNNVFDGIRFLQAASFTAGATTIVAQAAARSIQLGLAPPGGPIK